MPRHRVVLIAIAALVIFVTFRADANREMPDSVTLPDGTQLNVETVAGDFDTVWDMNWAPDGAMWITERGGRVARLDVSTGVATSVGEVPGVTERGESGLMGFAFHPDFAREPWVYFAHSYTPAGGGIGNRLVRMRYEAGMLGQMEVLLDGLRGAGNHNGSRLAIGPDRHLYMTMGEAGQRSRSQQRESLSGKILRLTLDGKAAPDNPFGTEVWSWGHRNPQGLVFHPGGALYSAEHGGRAEDEVNRIEKGANYGWPVIEGMCNTGQERETCPAFVEPLAVMAPTVGIAGLEYYGGDLIPGWKGSLIAVALRGASLYRIALSPDGRSSTNVERLFQNQFGRLRDALTGPDGSLYLATSNRDGRGSPAADDDRILRLRPAR